jgi:hypothetical protein
LKSSNTPRQRSEKLLVGELGKVYRKEHSKSLHYRPSSLRALGLKQLGYAALGVRRGALQLEQRQIAQLGMAVEVRARILLLFTMVFENLWLCTQHYNITKQPESQLTTILPEQFFICPVRFEAPTNVAWRFGELKTAQSRWSCVRAVTLVE